ncbi:MAG TPA: peptide deformylase [Burkholderiales bacterium]|nr:peptide deformylase [Burkholderiales bacterium]
MPVLEVLPYPDERLHQRALPVESVDDEVRTLVRDMAETMHMAPGVGLSATQADVHKQVIVVDVSEDQSDLKVLINPRLVEAEGTADAEEGCLSLPGIFETIPRAERIKVRALNVDGGLFEMEAEGLLSVCIQHEIDHLEGKVFIERLSRLKQSRILAKLNKQRRTG